MPGYRLDCGVSRQHNGMTALLLPLFTLNQIESNQLEGAVEVGCRLIKATVELGLAGCAKFISIRAIGVS